MTDHHPPPQPPNRDTRGNVVGDITHPDGTAESVDALNAWADAFETADTAQPLPPPTDPARRARHATIRGEVAAEEAAAGHGEAGSGPTGSARTSCPRCEGRGRVTIPCPTADPNSPTPDVHCLVLHLGRCPDCNGTGSIAVTPMSGAPPAQ